IDVLAAPLVEDVTNELHEIGPPEHLLEGLHLLFGERFEDVVLERIGVAFFDGIGGRDTDQLDGALVEVELHGAFLVGRGRPTSRRARIPSSSAFGRYTSTRLAGSHTDRLAAVGAGVYSRARACRRRRGDHIGSRPRTGRRSGAPRGGLGK